MSRAKKVYFILGIAALLIWAGLPFFVGGYWSRIVTFVSMYIILATSWNILGGYTGYASFGHAAFFGVGAYTSGVLMAVYHLPFLIALLGSIVVAVIVAAVISPVMRLKGHYFAIATLAVAEASREFVANMNLTGGGTGLAFPLRQGGIEITSLFFYFVMMGAALLAIIVGFVLRRSRTGSALLAIKASEDTAQSLGINVERYKLIALLISSAGVALAGGIYGYWITFIDPSSSFSVHISVTMIIMVLMGGAGSVLGPAIGAVLFEILTEVAWSHFLQLSNAVLGLTMILLILFLPRGIVHFFSEGLSWSAIKKATGRYSI